jgi:hypothetical protein
MLSLLRQQGVRHVLEDSSGNGGASVAAYAAAGGLKATIMAPDSTSTAKTIAMRAHGADVELIPGSRQACADAAVAAHGRGGSVFYASHNWHPFFLQGTKTLAYARSSTQASRLVRCRACWREYIGEYCVCIGGGRYELWEDLNFIQPDNVIIPTGAGAHLLTHLGDCLRVLRRLRHAVVLQARTSSAATSASPSCSVKARSPDSRSSSACSRWCAAPSRRQSSRHRVGTTASLCRRNGTSP